MTEISENNPFLAALIQCQSSPDRENNLQKAIGTLRQAADAGARLVVFPELSFSPFYPRVRSGGNHAQMAETIPGPTTDLFQQLAKELNMVVVLNLFEISAGKTFDSTIVIDADGSLSGVNRMLHILEAPGFYEKEYYHPGENLDWVFSTAVGRLAVAVCYDRHFPEYMRKLALEAAEIVVIPQAGAAGEWPDELFEAEVRVAAFQNGYFALLCNRVGPEPPLIFAGHSFACAPDGRILARADDRSESMLYCMIDRCEIDRSYARRHFLADRRPELYSSWFG